MDGPSHYLKLAYLAETAIVFNLAYIELKWKEDIKKLADNTKQLATLSSQKKFTRVMVCKERNCFKCESSEHITKTFNRFNIEYLSRIQNTVCSDPSIIEDVTTLEDIWSHADCGNRSKKIYKWFHGVANRGADRKLSFCLLVATTFLLIFITIIDVNLNSIDFLGSRSYESIWSFMLSIILLLSLLIPGVLWYTWRKFLNEYECLGLHLVNAYQQMSKDQVSGSVNDF